jgi:lipid-A-disaccharide synthase
VAQRLKKAGIPVVYLVAPQVWAWRRGRIRALRRNLDRLLCIFPFEEDFFLRAGVPAEYIGHPLARLVQPTLSREDFFRKHRIPGDRAMVAMLPGSRRGEVVRHLGALIEAAERINARHAATFLLASPPAFSERHGTWLKEAVGNAPVRLVEGETWNALAHADVALAASGTVTIEAALLGTPMVTFYRVTGVSWLAGRFLLDVPFYSMVNLIAGRKVVPELMQNEVRGERLAEEALRLLVDGSARAAMRRELTSVAARLQSEEDPLRKAARIAGEYLRK